VNVLKIEYISTDELIPYYANSRTHSESQVKQIAASIREFGFTNPILIDEKGTIIAGHGRLVAAQLLNIDEVPTITLNGLTDIQRKAYVIADNKLALNSGWDIDILGNELKGLEEFDFNLGLLGFEEAELNTLLGQIDFSPATEEEQGKLDQLDPKYIDCPHCGKEFDMRGIA
jgi:ParB family transcriptional regulator, chromosome partitioning protein